MNQAAVLTDKQLEKNLERIIFQKEELQAIAKSIALLREEKLDVDEFKAKLLETRVRIYTDILEFSKFYLKTMGTNLTEHLPASKTHSAAQKTEDARLREDLEQKNALLEEIAQRLQRLTS